MTNTIPLNEGQALILKRSRLLNHRTKDALDVFMLVDEDEIVPMFRCRFNGRTTDTYVGGWTIDKHTTHKREWRSLEAKAVDHLLEMGQSTYLKYVEIGDAAFDDRESFLKKRTLYYAGSARCDDESAWLKACGDYSSFLMYANQMADLHDRMRAEFAKKQV